MLWYSASILVLIKTESENLPASHYSILSPDFTIVEKDWRNKRIEQLKFNINRQFCRLFSQQWSLLVYIVWNNKMYVDYIDHYK